MNKKVMSLLYLLTVFFQYDHLALATTNEMTIEGLIERYRDEVRAHRAYAGYADRACKEGYPNIAHLFKSLAASEGIHARNFTRHLRDFNVDVATIPAPDAHDIGTTRSNLRNASAVERDEIDNRYPAILERIRVEGHDAVIRSITHAWQAEKQHRDLIEKIYNASKRWFGLLVGRIEGGESHYHICQICGSTLNEVPAGQCPICGHPASEYSEVSPYPKAACQSEESDW